MIFDCTDCIYIYRYICCSASLCVLGGISTNSHLVVLISTRINFDLRLHQQKAFNVVKKGHAHISVVFFSVVQRVVRDQ